MSVAQIRITANQCHCEKCAHDWVSAQIALPVFCPSCKSREWNGQKKNGRPFSKVAASRADLPRPTRVRAIA